MAAVGLGRATPMLKHRKALRRTALFKARSRRVALDTSHLEAAATSRCTLNLHALAAATIFDAEGTAPSAATAIINSYSSGTTAPATAGLDVTATTAAGNLSGSLAALSAAMFAGLSARGRRNRQSGDTRGKKQPGHNNSPST